MNQLLKVPLLLAQFGILVSFIQVGGKETQSLVYALLAEQYAQYTEGGTSFPLLRR